MRRADAAAARALLVAMLAWNKTETMREIYERVEPGEDGRIRTNVNPAGTETGRMSHSETFLERSTNLGNMPNRTAVLDPLFEVRSVLVPDVGRVLLEADYSQAEARVAAWEAGDPLAMEQYAQGVDRYRFFCEELYDTHEISKTVRNAVGKESILSLQYGVSANTLYNRVNANADVTGVTISLAQAKRAHALHHDLYPRYREWWERVFAEVCNRGYLVNPFGRKRIFFARTDSAAALEALKREAVAFGPQSTIADLLNSRMAYVYATLDPWLVRVLLQIHDAILCDCRVVVWRKAAEALRRALDVEIVVGGKPLRVPVDISVATESWAQKRKAA